MVRIRLRRVGGKKQPSYRIVAADKESPRDGRFLENLGFYNPRTEPATLQMEEDRIYDWMSKGAQPSDSVKQLFRTVGLMDRFARYKEGESIEVLLEEAETAAQARLGSLKTTGATPTKKSKKKEMVAAEPEPQAVVEPEVSEEKAEVEAEAETEAAEEKVEVEAEAETEAVDEAEVEAEAETEAAGEKAEVEVEAETEPAAEEKAEVEAEAETETADEEKVEVEAEAETEPVAEEKAEVEAEAEVAAEGEAEAEEETEEGDK
jgi:small subunit ribosomal protein S16